MKNIMVYYLFLHNYLLSINVEPHFTLENVKRHSAFQGYLNNLTLHNLHANLKVSDCTADTAHDFLYSPGADDSHKPHEVVHIARSITSNNKLMCVGTNPSSRKIEMKSKNFLTLCLTELLSSIFYYNRLGVRVMSGKMTTRLSDNLLFTWELLAMNTSSCAAFEKQRDGRQ